MYESLLDEKHPWIPSAIIHDVELQTIEALQSPQSARIGSADKNYMIQTCMVIIKMTVMYDIRVFRPYSWTSVLKRRQMRLSSLKVLLDRMVEHGYVVDVDRSIIDNDSMSRFMDEYMALPKAAVEEINDILCTYPIIIAAKSGYEV